MKAYFDNGATTPLDPEVLKAMIPFLKQKFGNAASLHKLGREASEAVENSREVIAKFIGAKPEEIVFTSGGTESNNFAIKGIAFAKKKGHLIVSKIEHDCVLNSAKWLEKQGFKVTYLSVDDEGFVNPEELRKAIQDDTFLVSVMHANNEIGTIQSLKEISNVCREKGVLLHSDACQSLTKVPVNVDDLGVDLMTINSHKIYGPKGVGALYIRKGVKIDPYFSGGGHENGKRSGTLNVPGIVGFGKSVQINHEVEHVRKLRNFFMEGVEKRIGDVKLNGPRGDKRLANNANYSFKYIEGEGLLFRLDSYGIAVSTASACASNTLEPSHVLISTGLPHEIAHGSLRFTFGKDNTLAEVEYVLDKLEKEVKELRKMSPYKRGWK